MTDALRDRYADALLQLLTREGPLADLAPVLERLDVLTGVDLQQKALTAPSSTHTPSVEGSTPLEHGRDEPADSPEGHPKPTAERGEDVQQANRPPHEGPEQAPVSASDGADATTVGAPAAPSPRLNRTPSGNPVSWERADRRGHFCIDSCGTRVSGPGKRCVKCSGLARRKNLIVPVIKRQSKPCPRCKAGTMYEHRELDGVEWRCLTCGNVSYGDGFVPLSDEPLTNAGSERSRRREPSHAGSRL